MLHVTRKSERQSADRETLDRFLDEQWWGVLSILNPHAGPPIISIPTLFIRDGDRLLVHGSTGAGALGTRKSAATSASFCITSMDDLILAHSTFDSSVNYRSAVIYGTLESAHPDDRQALLTTFTERLVPGRNAEVRPMLRKEIAATNVAVLRIDPGQWVYKERTGDVGVPEEDTDCWGGVIPMHTSFGEPRTAAWATGHEIPPSVRALRGEA